MVAFLQENPPLIPSTHDIALAKQSSKEHAALFTNEENDFQMIVKIDDYETKITFPFSSIKLLFEILKQMAEGNAITINSIHPEITSQEAANLLSVSHSYLIKHLDEGKISFYKIGEQRRIRLIDILHFKANSDKISQQALDELVQLGQELNMGY